MAAFHESRNLPILKHGVIAGYGVRRIRTALRGRVAAQPLRRGRSSRRRPARWLQRIRAGGSKIGHFLKILKTFAPEAGRRGVDLIWDEPEDLPERVVGDAGRLEQVLFNLLTNAIAHAPSATPIDVRLRQEGREMLGN